MSKLKGILATSVLFALAALACSPSNNSLNQLVRTGTGFGKGFTIDEMEIRPSDPPYEVEVWITGVIHDTCTRIGAVNQNRKANVIDLDFSIRPIDTEGCGDDKVVEFLQIVVLDTDGVGDGMLFVRSGDVSGKIKLPLEN